MNQSERTQINGTVVILLAVLASLARPAAAEKRPAWWNEAWPYRQRVEVVTPDPSKSINTALARIETEGKCAPDGHDIRVLDAQDNPVKYQVVEAAGGTVKIQFAAAQGVTTYLVYYGNPNAPAESHTWEKKVGGLTLKTMRHNAQRPPWSWPEMQRFLGDALETLGEGPRKQIDDAYNPFGDSDNYISVYKGTLYCPEAGWYTFATNSDDSSFLLIDGQVVVQWPGGHDVSTEWEHTGRIRLDKGIHEISYYHVEMTGGQLARAGWRPPGAKAITTIEPRYFIRELRTEVLTREALNKTVNAFFTFTEEAGITFNRSQRAFVPVAFSDRSLSEFGNIKLWEWNFGDGSPVSNDPSPRHEYTSAGEYAVTLECWTEHGWVDTCSRKLRLGEDLTPERVGLFLDVETDSPVLGLDEPVTVRLRCKADAWEDISARMVIEGVEKGDRLIYWTKEDVQVRKDNWTERSLIIDLPLEAATFTVRIEYLGVPVVEQVVQLMPAAACVGRLSLSEKGLVDEKGRPLLIRVGSEPYRPRNFLGRLQKGGPLNVVVIDDLLSPSEKPGTRGAAGGTYYDMLAKLLEENFPGLRAETHRLDSTLFEEYPPLERIGKVPPLVAEKKPDLVILAPGVMDILTYVPEQKYELYLWATVERLMACTEAEILLITPPPLMVHAELSRRYAYATKRVATRLGVPVADVYSAFSALGTQWQELYRDSSQGDEVYYVWPAERGQEIIAQRIYSTLIP